MCGNIQHLPVSTGGSFALFATGSESVATLWIASVLWWRALEMSFGSVLVVFNGL